LIISFVNFDKLLKFVKVCGAYLSFAEPSVGRLGRLGRVSRTGFYAYPSLILRSSFAEPSVGRVGQVGRVRVRAARGSANLTSDSGTGGMGALSLAK